MKNKKVLSIFMAILMMSSLASCTPSQEKTDELKDTISQVENQMDDIAEENKNVDVGTYVTPDESCFSWEDADGGVAITEYTGTDMAVIIPATLDGKNVVDIKSGAFSNVEIKGVKLPDNIVKLGEFAFYYCTTLKEVIFGANTVEIGKEAFEGCVSLSNVELNVSMETIGRMAFATTSSLESISFPEGLKTIGSGAFVLSGLKSATVPGTVELIDEQAFCSCQNMETITFEDGVTSISNYVFEGTSNLKDIYIPDTVTEIGSNTFHQVNNPIIHAPAGSYAETYATENEFDFVATN